MHQRSKDHKECLAASRHSATVGSPEARICVGLCFLYVAKTLLPSLNQLLTQILVARDEQVDLQWRASNVVHWYVQKLYRIQGQEKHAQDLRKRLEKKYKFRLPPLGPTTPVASLRNASIQQHPELQGNSEFFQKYTAYHLYIKLWKWFEDEKGKQDTGARGGSMNTFTKDSASHQKQRLFKAVKKWFDEDLVQYLASHEHTSENFESVRGRVRLGPAATQVLMDNFDNTPDPGQSHRTSVDNMEVFVGASEGPRWNLPAPILVHILI